MITGRQIRAARGLLGWDATDLAAKADLTRETVSKIETESVHPHDKTLARILRAFDENGVEFTDNSGVRLKPQNIEVLEGTPGFARFYEVVYEHLVKQGGTVCVSGVDEALFAKYRPSGDEHRIRMTELAKTRNDLIFKILVKEGDYNFTASAYGHYRWQPKEYFSPTPFYVFGDCLALISFVHDPAPLVILTRAAPFAEAYRQYFNLAWSNATEPPAKKGRQE